MLTHKLATLSALSGLTILELMITLAITGLLFALGAPSFSAMQHRYQAYNEIQALHMAIYATRATAITNNSPTALCPLVQNQCKREWDKTLTAFQDLNKNQRLDPGEVIITTVAPSEADQVLRRYPKKSFRFDAQGFAGFNNGSFSYCRVAGDDLKTGAAFIVSRLGRIRRGGDSDNDGLPETANGKNVICPRR